MPLQNRVTPTGELVATPARGLLMGNRGGRFHDPATRTPGTRRWVSQRWIACRLAFRGRHRRVWGEGYTELFFLDEVTALAAGHRPCFECRRDAATAFARAMAAGLGLGGTPDAASMDARLHRERLAGPHPAPLASLPDGSIVDRDGLPWAVRGGYLIAWTVDGYAERRARPAGGTASVITPACVIAALRSGYAPMWHATAAG